MGDYVRIVNTTGDLSAVYRRNSYDYRDTISKVIRLDVGRIKDWCEANLSRLREERGSEWTKIADDWYQGPMPSHGLSVVHDSPWVRKRRKAWKQAGDLQWYAAREETVHGPWHMIASGEMLAMDKAVSLSYREAASVARIAGDAALARLVRELVSEKTYRFLVREWVDLSLVAG